ncbi:autotransporter assembly complex protein TamA [Alteriqipengyuania lutimaris]|uniref:autotransporter assembly complex protein TamA n=1 Tax=Alteriqipengyuania lutimaris TaxID=1538146 RepID=UPI0017E59221|nr:BamA/TamA family outer membrane protein [Alteriqipengyuania lutimaris]MBB3033421.1 translocation and assembly module TamA [Alteriqipengyuania lutimaris]
MTRRSPSAARPLRSACLSAIALVLAGQSAAALAQDRDANAELEALIPDEALDDPESWAADGIPPEEPSPIDGPDPFPADLPELEPESPLSELPGLTIEWPAPLELPDVEQVEDDGSAEFSEDNPLESGPMLIDPVVVDLTEQLALAFPSEPGAFPQQDEFVSQFETLSSIEAYGDTEANVGQLGARAREDQEILTRLLRAYGYYDGEIIREVGPNLIDGSDTRPQVRFNILPGERFRFGEIDLGALEQAPDSRVLRQSFGLFPGDFVDSYEIIRERADLDVTLGNTGFPFAEIDGPELLIDHARTQSDLTMPVRPNGQYNFGRVISDLPDFLSSEHLASIARFEPGDLYSRELEQDLRRAIIATGLVSSVTITPVEAEPPTDGSPGTVDMNVGLTEAELRTIAGAIGYGTEEGFRIAASWEHRNLFPPEGALRVRGIAGTQEQLLGVTFRKSNFGGRDRILTLDAFAGSLDNAAFAANTAGFIGTYERPSTLLFQKPFSWSIGLELVASDERLAFDSDNSDLIDPEPPERQTYFVAAVPGFAQIDTSDDLLNPTEGFRVSMRASPEVSHTEGMQSFYIRNQADASYYRQIGDDGPILAGRIRLGSINGAPLGNIAPSRRFFAGGGGSVRGYGFREVGPRNEDGDPTGGRSLLELSAEARIPTPLFNGAVQVVPFVDAGSVSTQQYPDFEDIRIGAGLGVRYLTGFGPLRLDVAFPVNPRPSDSFVAVYVSLGQAF